MTERLNSDRQSCYHPAAHTWVPQNCCGSGARGSSSCRLRPTRVQPTTPISFGKGFERSEGGRPPVFCILQEGIHSVYKTTCLLLSRVQLFCDPMDCSPTRPLCPWDSPGKNTGVGCHFLLQGIFLSQRSNLRLLHG